MKLFFTAIFLLTNVLIFGQNYSNPVAIHKDSSIIVGWATSAVVERGFVKISDTTFTYTDNPSGVTSNYAFYGSAENGTGKADGQFVSLGDGGKITLQFASPIMNKDGADFAVFENALLSPPNQDLLVFPELAFVEVSSDGEYFARFPSISHASSSEQIGTFGTIEWNAYENLAGNLPVFYGTPFDLSDIDDENIDLQNITHVRLIDVVGSIDPEFASYDSQGNIINDPYPTPFHSCGFDLDAVGVIHAKGANVEEENLYINVFPNPANQYLNISCKEECNVAIYNVLGQKVGQKNGSNKQHVLELSNYQSGTYFVELQFRNKKIVKQIYIIQ